MRTQKKATERGFLEMARDKNGKPKLVEDEMLAGMLMEMGTGHKNTPKGGLSELALAIENGDACGVDWQVRQWSVQG